ncbi:hypothetical protein WUBG_06117 [Wuchereria bancrofti]|uniref:Neurotransmitter-gated ion-channel ligand-binding domain-containing protein n=1 Tax=Wuchereria bancrofti TaxID=6293 RepID=J9EL97_WUCBA|nr:hypothetical protein WUBG_06117 [Wuchereria bancrofti]
MYGENEVITVAAGGSCFEISGLSSNRYADQLYEDLLYFYNKNVRPVRNASSAVQVKFGASLIRIIDVVSSYNFKLII